MSGSLFPTNQNGQAAYAAPQAPHKPLVCLRVPLCPFVSSFSAPVYFVMGDIGWGLMLGSWAVQLALVLVLYKVSGRVYDRLIIYTGRRIKLGEILAMAGKGEK